MKPIIVIILTIMLTAFFTGTLNAGEFTVKKSETIEKNLSFPGGALSRALEIDNIFGAIHLEGYSGSTVKLSAVKTIKAHSREKLETARKEVKLDISNQGNKVIIYVDGPFRDKDNKNHVNWNSTKRGYIVKYDFTLKVPVKTDIKLKTVNSGDIKVSGVVGKCTLSNVNEKIRVHDLTGDFQVTTVNGPIRMDRITGSGNAHTVNGKVTVNFVKNPATDCSFHTINGKLDIDFRPGLSANFKLKTFNGKIYSDFPATYLPASPGKGSRQDGKYVYKSRRHQAVRIGKGGPTIKMDTLNGSIYINEGE
ncbi:MAG: hypothetical protein GY940_40550 [bacterium]|nr:hypothetical protein [bacterium]